jgi:hypothetical protein
VLMNRYKIAMLTEFIYECDDDKTIGDIDFYLNDSSSCAINILSDLCDAYDSPDVCPCAHTKFKVFDLTDDDDKEMVAIGFVTDRDCKSL